MHLARPDVRRQIVLLVLAGVLPFLIAPVVFHLGRASAPDRFDNDPFCLLATLAIGSLPLCWFPSKGSTKAGLIYAYAFVMPIPVGLFILGVGHAMDPSDLKPSFKEIAWFAAETGVRFPNGTEYLLYRKEDSFVGSGGVYDLKVRIPAAKGNEFFRQPTLPLADWSLPGPLSIRPELVGWASSDAPSVWSAEIDLPRQDDHSKGLKVEVASSAGPMVDVYFEYLY